MQDTANSNIFSGVLSILAIEVIKLLCSTTFLFDNSFKVSTCSNFKMDLSGFSEFRYGVEIVEQGTAEKDMMVW